MATMHIEKGYTTVNNYPLRDKDLSLAAVGLLTKLLSLPETWEYSIRGLAAICKEGKDFISSTLKELEEAGYIERKQIRGEGGTFGKIEYYVYMTPHLNEEPEALENRDISPRPASPDTVEPDTVAPNPVKPPQIKTKRNETKEAKDRETENINYLPKSTTGELSREDRERYRRLLTEKLRPAGLKKLYPDSRKTVDSFIEIAFRAVTTSKKTLRIGGEELPADDVRQRLLSLTDEHLEQVLKAWEANSTNVRNPRQYMLTMLYNVPMSIDAKQKTDQTAAPPVTLDELKAVLAKM